MKLSYRFASYNYTPLNLEATETEIVGTYRGVPSHCRTVQAVAVPQPDVDLVYRGVEYHSTPTELGSYRPIIRPALNASGPSGKSTRIATARKMINDVHQNNLRHNLERRLQAAKARGDEHLVELLEAESRELIGL